MYLINFFANRAGLGGAKSATVADWRTRWCGFGSTPRALSAVKPAAAATAHRQSAAPVSGLSAQVCWVAAQSTEVNVPP